MPWGKNINRIDYIRLCSEREERKKDAKPPMKIRPPSRYPKRIRWNAALPHEIKRDE